MNLYSKIQEKIIFTEKVNPKFFHYEVNRNINSNYEIYDREYVFKGNISKTFANNTFANIIFSTDPLLIEETIAYHIGKICNKDLKMEKAILLRMRKAIYAALEMPLPISIFEYMFKLNNRYKDHVKEFERVVDCRLNDIYKKNNFNISENPIKKLLHEFKITKDLIIVKLNNLEVSSEAENLLLPDIKISERHSTNFQKLNSNIQDKIWMCHEIDFVLAAFNLKLTKTRIDGRIEIAKKLDLDLTNKIILIEVKDQGGYFYNAIKTRKKETFENFKFWPHIKDFASK